MYGRGMKRKGEKVRKIERIAAAFIAAVLAAACAVPAFAWAEADESLGSVDEPAVSITAADATDSTTIERDQQTFGDITVSAEGDAALIEGCRFGMNDFSRAQSGSNRAVDGAYHGYNYYLGAEPENVAVVSTGDYAVAYISAKVLQQFGISLDNDEDVATLKEYLIALDAANARGSSRLSTVPTWYFTDQPAYELNGATFRFDEQLTEGRYYLCVIGTDGADVTSQSHPNYITLEHADFARIVWPDEVTIVHEATGLAWIAEFLQNIDYSPLWVTLRTTGIAIVIIFVLGLAAAYFTLRISPRAQDIFDSIFTIPMVLPPTVCGFLLLLAFGRSTPLGQWFIDVGFPLVFSWQATVIAAVIVAFPLMYRSARGAFENLDPNMLDAARTLGWSNPRIFFKLMLPLAWSSIAAGTVLSFARALGEFGATLFMAGNYAGITRTIPIAIYFEWMNGNTDVAIFWTIVIMIFSFIVILFINLWSRRTTKYRRKSVEEDEKPAKPHDRSDDRGGLLEGDAELERGVAAFEAKELEGGARA